MIVPTAHCREHHNCILAVTAAAVIMFLMPGSRFIPNLSGQSKSKPSRIVIRTVNPLYPAIVKNARIGGTVRLNAVVLANGTVARVQILGGNPILAESAAKAVMNWKYAPASAQTTEEVVVDFNSHELP
jgi:TonB family protein